MGKPVTESTTVPSMPWERSVELATKNPHSSNHMFSPKKVVGGAVKSSLSHVCFANRERKQISHELGLDECGTGARLRTVFGDPFSRRLTIGEQRTVAQMAVFSSHVDA
jgi:hypothetical protein